MSGVRWAPIVLAGLVACSYDFSQFDSGPGSSGTGESGGTSGGGGNAGAAAQAGTGTGGTGTGGTGTGGTGTGGTGTAGFAGTAGNSGGTCSTVAINFQPNVSDVPAGYAPDVGTVFGPQNNGCSYGWGTDISNLARRRHKHPDLRLDTLNQMQVGTEVSWEIALPEGTYDVTLVAGDAQFIDSIYAIEAEGLLIVDGIPTGSDRFVEGNALVRVTDGRLTLSNAPGSLNNKVCYIEIQRVP